MGVRSLHFLGVRSLSLARCSRFHLACASADCESDCRLWSLKVEPQSGTSEDSKILLILSRKLCFQIFSKDQALQVGSYRDLLKGTHARPHAKWLPGDLVVFLREGSCTSSFTKMSGRAVTKVFAQILHKASSESRSTLLHKDLIPNHCLGALAGEYKTSLKK